MTTSDSHLPVAVRPSRLATPVDGHLVPALIADEGDSAAWRYIEFFTATSGTKIRAGLTRGPVGDSSPGARIAG